MKSNGGFVSAYSSPMKRRWKCFITAVLSLVFLSMLVPLVFLLGFHNRFHNGFGAEKLNSVLNNQSHLILPGLHKTAETEDQSKALGDDSYKDILNDTIGFPVPVSFPEKNNRPNVRGSRNGNIIDTNDGEVMCELKFGTYCPWLREQKEEMDDSLVKKMKDLLFVARAYYPSIAKLPKLDKLSQEMKQNIQEYERILSEASTDRDLPPNVEPKLSMMGATISKAKSFPVDCNNVDKKFRQLVDITEDEADFHMKQSVFLYKLAVQTMPKSLHCLSMRLTVEYFRSPFDTDQEAVHKFSNPELHHYVIFSTNILASSVVINSTVVHSRETGKLVFHIVTDGENYYAMKFWFSNRYGEAAVQVLNIEDYKSFTNNEEASHLSFQEEFQISFYGINKLSSLQVRTHYLSTFSHSHHLLPIIFQSFEKVVVLDDDIVVQRDLSELWNIDMAGNVISAVQFCPVMLFHLQGNLASSEVSENSCAWTSGINTVDISRWRERNVSDVYRRLAHEMSKDGVSSDASKLSANLLTFQGLVHPLDKSWMLSGLGHNYGIDLEAIRTAGVLHFNGRMKPWLELGIPDYKTFWRKFLNPESQFLNDCNVDH